MQTLEAVWNFLLSVGITGSVTALILKRLITNAEREADRRRDLRYRQELIRLEGEDCLAGLILALAEYCRDGRINEADLIEYEQKYKEYLAKSRAFSAELYASSRTGRKV